MKKQNLLVLGICIILIAAVGIMAVILSQTRTLSDEAPVIPAADVSSAAPAPAASEEPPVAEPAAYLVVSVGGMLYEPLPLSGEGSFTIRQDEQIFNTIHVTPDSVFMEHSSCENQDCVDQGTVSLDNMNNRVLGNMIICLPNEVVLELHTPETLETTFDLIP